MIYKSYLVEENLEILKNNKVLFYGENLGLKDDFKKEIIKKNKKNLIMTFLQEEVVNNQEKFIIEVNNTSLFESKKIFFIHNANDKILKIIDELERNNHNNYYLFSDNLDKKSKLRSYFENGKKTDIVPCYKDNDINIKKFISKNLHGFSGISPEVINLLIDFSNNDRTKLKNEFEKIKNFFTNKIIKIDDLIKLLNLRENEDFNEIKDAALNGNRLETNKLLNFTILEKDKSPFYLSIINNRLSKLKELTLYDNKNIEEAVNRLRPPVFWKDKPKLVMQKKIWNLNKLNIALGLTYDVEIKLKSNSDIDDKIILKKLIVDICNLANVA